MYKDEKTFYIVPEVIYTPLSFLFPLATCTPINLSSLSFCLCFFPSCCLCFSALFVGVLEKTVEGEAAALTKAKTLYKSCTNERKSAGIRCQHRLLFSYLHTFFCAGNSRSRSHDVFELSLRSSIPFF